MDWGVAFGVVGGGGKGLLLLCGGERDDVLMQMSGVSMERGGAG